MSRISSGTMTVAVFAILIGLAGAYTVRQYLNEVPKPPAVAETPKAQPRVALATVDLMPGKTIAFGDIIVLTMTLEQIAERKIPTDAMSSPRDLIGRILRTPLKKGEPFRTTSLYPDGMGPTVGERLKPGLRAVTISVGDIGSVAGLVHAGSNVDVMLKTKPRRRIPETTLTLLEKVEVLAVGETLLAGVKGKDRAGTKATLVTLAVSPDQAKALKVVEQEGELSLAMRSADDEAAPAVASRMTLDKLLGLQAPPEPATMEIYRGGSRQTVVFDNNQVVAENFGGLGTTPVPAFSTNGRAAAPATAAVQAAITPTPAAAE